MRHACYSTVGIFSKPTQLNFFDNKVSALRLLTGILLILFFVPVAQAQRTSAEIVGTVTDASGALMPGVSVTVTNLNTGASQTAVTDASGNYLVTLLPVGHYSLRAEMPGFKAASIPEIALTIGDRSRQEHTS